MTQNTATPNRPTHAVYQVNGDGNNARWLHIGAAWMHSDLKGANLKFDCLPLAGRVVIREVGEQDNDTGQHDEVTTGGAE